MSDSIAEAFEPVPGEPPKKPKGDLGVRTVSAVVMIAVAGSAFWAGGLIWTIFLGAIGVALLWEYWNLVRAITHSTPSRIAWLVGGATYFGVAIYTAVAFSNQRPDGGIVFVMILCSVIATDIGAYFAGRTFGGPKIARSISPSKTWSGLAGGMLFAGSFLVLFVSWVRNSNELDVSQHLPGVFLTGTAIAVVAQAGDFFESWLKRRAGVKDSGKLIPGHGGFFDRADGMIAVFFVMGIFVAGSIVYWRIVLPE